MDNTQIMEAQVLAEMSETIGPVNDVLEIDAENRVIIVPETELIFGVEEDVNVERKYFRCPRFIGDNIDLSKMTLRINFKNAISVTDIYIVEDVTVNGDYIEFSWLLSKKLLAEDGKVSFNISAIDVDDEGFEMVKWSTTSMTGTVLAGLKVDDLYESEEDQARDVLQQIVNVMNEQSAATVQNVKVEGATQIANMKNEIDTKGAAVLESIPDDYTALSNQVELNTRYAAPIIKRAAEGKNITVNDSAKMPILGLNLYGKSMQLTDPTPSNPQEIIDVGAFRNLLNVRAESQTINGITYTVNADKSITANGTATNSSYFILDEGMVFEAGSTYVLSGCPAGGDASNTYHMYVENNSVRDYGNGAFFTVTETNTNRTVILIRTGTTVSDLTFYPMIRKADVLDDTYYPYTGKKEILTTILGKNLYDCRDASDLQTGVIANDDFVTIEYDNSEGSSIVYRNQWTKPIAALKPNTEYKIIVEVKEISECTLFAISRKNLITPESQFSENKSITETGVFEYTLETNSFDSGNILSSLRSFVQFNAGQKGKCMFRIAVYDADCESIDYTSYVDSQVIRHFSDNGLLGIPVESDGNYTDSEGQQWFCDEIDFERGVYVRRVGIKELDASSDEYWYELTATGGTIYAHLISDALANESNQSILCTHFVPSILKTYTKEADACYFYNTTFRICLLSVDSLDGFKEWLTSNPITVVYPLATPIETALSEEELLVYKALHTNYLTTNMVSDSDAHLKLIYAADTKTYIDNKFAELSAIISSNA